jgi:Flp pilus assembly protein TadG
MATMNIRSRRGQEGQAIIELALTLPLLLLVVFGVFDFGFLFQRYEVVTNAAREGARVGVLTNYTGTDAENRALAYLTAGGMRGPGSPAPRTRPCLQPVSAGTVNTVCVVATRSPDDFLPLTLPAVGTAPARVVHFIRVEVQYDYQFRFVGPLMNLFGGTLGTTRIRAVSTMRFEP